VKQPQGESTLPYRSAQRQVRGAERAGERAAQMADGAARAMLARAPRVPRNYILDDAKCAPPPCASDWASLPAPETRECAPSVVLHSVLLPCGC